MIRKIDQLSEELFNKSNQVQEMIKISDKLYALEIIAYDEPQKIGPNHEILSTLAIYDVLNNTEAEGEEEYVIDKMIYHEVFMVKLSTAEMTTAIQNITSMPNKYIN